MNSIEISLIVFSCIFGGAILGMFLRAHLPEHHQSGDSQRIVNLGAGIIGTMAALVLGLLVASAKGTYDTQNNELITMGAKMVLADRALGLYGPEAKDTRDLTARCGLGNDPTSLVEPATSCDRPNAASIRHSQSAL